MNQPRRIQLVLAKEHGDQIVLANATATHFEIDRDIEDGTWMALICGKSDSRYPIGEVEVLGRRVFRKKTPNSLPGNKMEDTAVRRLYTILRRGHQESTVSVRIISENVRFESEGNIRPLVEAPSAPIFVTEHTNPINFESSHTCIITVTVTGVSFAFDGKLLEKQGNLYVWQLPRSAWRMVRRTAPRRSLNRGAHLLTASNRDKTAAHVTDMSPLGCGFTSASPDLEVWDEVTIQMSTSDNEVFSVSAMIIECDSNGRIGCVFGTDQSTAKSDFFLLHATYAHGLSFAQSAEEAWNCLESNGYLDLLDGGQLRSVQANCLEAWKATDQSPNTFQPVAKINQIPIGTIAASKISEKHWVPHSLATSVEPENIGVTEALYQSWPLYLLSQGRPTWFSTWYDAEKPWHNRFYQVFIHEHQESGGCFSFVRRWHWCPQIALKQENLSRIRIEKMSDQKDSIARTKWLERYGENRTPFSKMEDEDFFVFSSKFWTLKLDGHVIGAIHQVTSDLEMNPFGVFNVLHINIFERDLSNDEKFIKQVVSESLTRLIGKSRSAGITVDYDCEVDLRSCGFMSFAVIRCLAADSHSLKGMLSNNALCFADMRTRKA